MKIVLLIAVIGTLFFSFSVWTPPEKVENLHLVTDTLIDKEEVNNESILFVGDIMLGRSVEKLIQKQGGDYLFSQIAPLFASSTYIVGNLEGPIPETHVPTPPMGFQFSFASSTASLLARYRFTALSQANNHGSDWGEKGWEHTRKVLTDAGIKGFGHAHRPDEVVAEITVEGISYIVVGINVVSDYFSKDEQLAYMTFLSTLYRDSRIIAVVHWGEEYAHRPSKSQQEFARSLIDRGVDVIIGAHPHVIQGVEVYNNAPIFYSLGNFIFDQYFSKEVQTGYAVSLSPGATSTLYTIIPLRSSLSVPYVATGSERDAIIRQLQQLSTSTPLENGEFVISQNPVSVSP